MPLNIPFVFVWCYAIATFAHRVSAAYFVGGEPLLGVIFSDIEQLDLGLVDISPY